METNSEQKKRVFELPKELKGLIIFCVIVSTLFVISDTHGLRGPVGTYTLCALMWAIFLFQIYKIELVNDQETGFLVKPKDVSSMSNAITTLLDNPEMAQKMGMKGRERIDKNFNIPRITDQFVSLWQEVALGRSTIATEN